MFTRKQISRKCTKALRHKRQFTDFLSGANAAYAEKMYESWNTDPDSVHPSWAAYFATGGFSSPDPSVSFTPSPSSGTSDHRLVALNSLIRAYQFSGHFMADLDPLSISGKRANRKGYKPEQLEPSFWGFTEKDMDIPIKVSGTVGPIKSMLSKIQDPSGCVTLNQVVKTCEQLYCGKIGYEFMHISNVDKCNWLRNQIEVEGWTVSPNDKKGILREIAWANLFETFLNTKYPAQKRFGLDGIETMIVALKQMVNSGADSGVDDFVMGMPHRGRLNVLANVVRKPLSQILHEFAGAAMPEEAAGGSGDVKYHLGASHDRLAGTKNDRLVHLSLVANPSHLETVDPVVLGKTRAKMHYKEDEAGKHTCAVLMHGDAAFAGQGVVYECYGFADLPDYHTGGSIHLVVNNQIGFTTDPYFARSSPYCTSLARAYANPIFHVNADDPEAVVRVSALAMKYRQQFQSDATIDLIGYRKHGHNEGDEPSFTQPLMYDRIRKMDNVYKQYCDKLIAEGVVTDDYIKAQEADILGALEEAFAEAKSWEFKISDWLDSRWEGFKTSDDLTNVRATGVSSDEFDVVAGALQKLPDGFTVHRRIKKVLEGRNEQLSSGKGIDWGTAEALAFGSLLREGCHVRLSGQDVERGTFSHRHAVLHEQKNVDVTNRPQYRPLQHMPDSKATFTVCNSPLSEYGVLGFDLGYSLESPHALVCWEAQFGDFANGAQTMFDTYIAAGEAKWVRMTGLVCLLPHGFEGGGPEHSSCRLERFLQMCDDDPYTVPEINEHTQVQVQHSNWQVMNISTPANYFHALRRQIHRNFRKPMIVASPKWLLRRPISSKEEFLEGTKFERMIEDSGEALCEPSQVKRLIVCSGKIYYALEEERKRLGIDNVAISRVEQISPFPFDRMIKELERFSNAEVYWVQEEPMNMGCWTYVEPRMRTCLSHMKDDRAAPGYVGRSPAAAPATGFKKLHEMQEAAIMRDAFSGIETKSA